MKKADAWWRRNRDAVDLFTIEFREALASLASSPLGPPVIRIRRGREIRRVLMARTEFHVYYFYDAREAVASVVTVWGARRGRGPFR